MKEKLSQHLVSIILWSFLITAIFLLGAYLINEAGQEKKTQNNPTKNAYRSILKEKRIQNEDNLNEQTIEQNIDQNLDQDKILLKQQLQISDLRDELGGLKMDVMKLKTDDSLSKIILTFVKLRDLSDSNQPYEKILRKLEILTKADFILVTKVALLKENLDKKQKSQKELKNQLISLSSQINVKKIQIENENKWVGKLKSTILQFISIRRTDGQKNNSDIEILITEIHNNIETREYDLALHNIDLIDEKYQEILVNFRLEIEKSADLKKSFEDIYQYLEALSNL